MGRLRCYDAVSLARGENVSQINGRNRNRKAKSARWRISTFVGGKSEGADKFVVLQHRQNTDSRWAFVAAVLWFVSSSIEVPDNVDTSSACFNTWDTGTVGLLALLALQRFSVRSM